MTPVEMIDKSGARVVVLRDSARSEFLVADLDQSEVAGRTLFVERPDKAERIFFHTEVPASWGGRGLASILVRQAVEATRSSDLTVVAICPLVKAFVEKHGDELGQDARVGDRDDLGWLRSALAERGQQ